MKRSGHHSWGKTARRYASLLLLVTVLAEKPALSQPFSLLCMPDPQYYTTSNHPTLYDLYRKQARWVRDNAAAYNVEHVIWLGDLTNNNTATQWGVANNAYSILDGANVPYAVVPGNHDYMTANSSSGWIGAQQRNLALYNNIVGPARFAAKEWYGGNMGETLNKNENNYTYFSSNGLNFLVIGLEYAPRKEVLTWANNLISQHPNHRVILFTHAYMTTNGAYAGGAGSGFGIVGANGSEIFDECASRHSNVFMVVCGHVTESVTNTKTGLAGNLIYEMLVDYQGEKIKGTGSNLGNGWLRILQFDPANNRISASTVTPAAGDANIFQDGLTRFYETSRYSSSPAGADHLFTKFYNMTDPMEPYTYLNASVDFHAMGVAGNLLSDQLDPDIAQDDKGNWVSVWEDDGDDNGIYQVHVRGFDSDGNVRFTKSAANTIGLNTINATNPSVAMAADGRFVVAWQSGATQISMRAYNADGTPVGATEQSVITVNTPGTVNNPDVGIDNAGNFVVAWADDADGNSTFQVRARGFAHNYTQRFAAKTVNTISMGQQLNPVVAMAANGDYIVGWEDDKDGTWDIGIRGYLANETERFAQALGNMTTAGEQVSPAIAMDDSGRFVVVWEDDADLNNSYQVRARGFAANGTELFSERTVNGVAAGNQINPTADMDNLGNWYVAWEDSGVGGQGFQIMSNAFDISGAKIHTADIRANATTSVTHRTSTASSRKSPTISGHKSGRYVVGWSDDMEGDGINQALARGIAGTATSLVVKSINGAVTRSNDQPFYAPGETVTLTAAGNPGHTFLRWSGDVPAGSEFANPMTITMTSNKRLTAVYSNSSDVGDWQLY